MENVMKIIGLYGLVEVGLPSTFRVAKSGLIKDQNGVCDFVDYAIDGLDVWVSYEGFATKFRLPDPNAAISEREARAPMTGRVVAIPVEVGKKVSKGDPLIVLEAMKMEYKLEAHFDGEVELVGAEVGDLVDLGHLLVRLK
jgi:acetyl/propionyl-CoA carboxylase alpha subunit